MISHREASRLLFAAIWRSTNALLLILGAISVLAFGALGATLRQKSQGWAYFLENYFDPYRIYVVLVLLVIASYLGLRRAVSDDRDVSHGRITELQRTLRATTKRRDQLEDLLKPRAEVVLINGCCVQAALVSIGVSAKPVKSLRTTSVYVDIPAVGVKDRVLAWAHPNPDPERTIDIHHGRHHHTQAIAVVGDVTGKFYLSLGYQSFEVGPGPYEINVYVKGRDAMMTEAKLEIVFTMPRGVGARLL